MTCTGLMPGKVDNPDRMNMNEHIDTPHMPSFTDEGAAQHRTASQLAKICQAGLD